MTQEQKSLKEYIIEGVLDIEDNKDMVGDFIKN